MRPLPLATLLLGLTALPALAQPRITILDSQDANLTLGEVTSPGGKIMRFTVGIGSAAHRRPTDPADIVHTLSDRGPNFTCAEAPEITGLPRDRICAADRNGRVYPTPGYSPTLYGVRLDEANRTFHVFDAIAVKDRDGRPVTGLTNPLPGRTETPIDAAGNRLDFDPNAIDAEGLFRAPDGTLWVGEENAPSVVHIAADGRILRRYVPAGTEGELAGAHYEVAGTLPAILAKRQSNRGIESLTAPPDGSALYVMVQNPLANPDAAAFRDARNSRLLRIDPATGQATGEWVYQLDDPRSFRLDPSARQSDPRISEMTWLGPNRLLVLERTDGTTKLYEVKLDAGATDILNSRWDDAATRPTLEQSNDLAGTGVVPLAKRLVLDTADHPELPVKLEGMAILPDDTLLLINDDDFGITGQRTRIVLVRGLGLTN
ncbi:esterase-like activity of phytase family protein [Roseomonas sp. OT10]|uniref:esterase-like activity of phytase family protein n=1 Tax=Roseomonas cutis TaxID=2897332 RepID=UPI001E4DF6D4|nr:esterase-like activity of phytase family protein [Roseomonas sp. OT10]UFN48888.1 esterase-like activity of phytase family protein [Roseomonas sp. OT10]